MRVIIEREGYLSTPFGNTCYQGRMILIIPPEKNYSIDLE